MGGLAIAQIGLESQRWHLYGAYFGTGLIVALVSLWSRLRPSTRKALALIAAIGFVVSGAFAYIFPVFELPALSGSYRVGTATYDFTENPERAHIASTELGPRKLAVHVFYPSNVSDRQQGGRYMPTGMTTYFKPQLAMVRTRAVPNAEIVTSKSRFPVLIYSHSWNGSRFENTYLAQDLASHGYVVACIDDPEDTPTTVYADGQIVRHRGARWLDFSSTNALHDTLQTAQHDLAIRIADVRFVLNELTRLNNEDAASKFYGHLDLAHVGVLGYSFGGTTAAEVCRVDPRFKAGVNLDGYSFAIGDVTAIRQPFLIMTDSVESGEFHTTHDPARDAQWRFDNGEYQDIVSSFKSYGGYLVLVEGTEHANFSDLPLYCRLRIYTGAGPIDPFRAMRLMSTYVVGFFDKELKGKSSTLLERPSPDYPEVKLLINRATPSVVLQ